MRGVHNHMLGESPRAKAVDDRVAGLVVKRRRAVERKHLFAEYGRALGACRAEAAIADERHHHMIPGFNRETPGPTASTTPAASCP